MVEGNPEAIQLNNRLGRALIVEKFRQKIGDLRYQARITEAKTEVWKSKLSLTSGGEFQRGQCISKSF